jgi:hypothetical protein
MPALEPPVAPVAEARREWERGGLRAGGLRERQRGGMQESASIHAAPWCSLNGMDRRDFLKWSGLGLAGVPALGAKPTITLAVNGPDVTPAVEWALGELRSRVDLSDSGAFRVWIGDNGGAQGLAPEAYTITPVRGGIDVMARDQRGHIYAITELARRADQENFGIREPLREAPANPVRSVTRCFVSDVEDKAWYNDREMWPEYLGMLVKNRFNRFSLAYGIGYDFARDIRDCYFHFPYPFLMDVKGYNVRAKGLPDEERDRNFAMLKFIAKETVKKGLDFQLAIWTHAFTWANSPNANYTIEGLTPEKQAAYCHDALARILDEVPEISGLTFRVHGESGVAEGSYDFWKTLFSAAANSGRKIGIDMHAKGMDGKMIDTALSTGLPITISPKFMAEHMGLPYQQAGIRELEMPTKREGFFALSEGERRFMRYSYGDLFDEKRKYQIVFRIWPGTQHLLLWGDPEFASSYGKAFQFCGAAGVEWCEPLAFKGKKGGGGSGSRCAYLDASLAPKWDWQKFEYSYQLFGRALYNPAGVPKATAPAETALAHASRILPLITSAHGASAANNNYWPEIYYNMSIVDPKAKHPYSDSPTPRKFGTVSPFDPEIFARIDDHADDLLLGKPSVKYTPVDVATWLDSLAVEAAKNLGPGVPRRWAIDIDIQAGIGRFFAAKFRSGVLWAIHEKTGDRAALEEALKQYRAARAAWASFAERAKAVYLPDIPFGYEYQQRGHWFDRLAQIDEDIARMEQRLAGTQTNAAAAKAVAAVLKPAARSQWTCRHAPPARFQPGQPVAVALEVSGKQPSAATLHYRHVNQVERFTAAEMTGSPWRATIPAEFTRSPYPLQYYFSLDHASMYPGLAPNLANQPYFVVRQA